MAKVLVIDDEQDLCLALKLYLERLGHKPLLFQSAAAARQALAAGDLAADFAFVDHQLGTESGTDLAKLLLRNDSKLRVILMSGLPLDDEELAEFSGERVVFLQKPFRSTEVAACLSRIW